MTPRKLNRAFALVGITMPTVRAHIERNMQAAADQLAGMTAAQLSAVISIHNTAYHQGRSSCGEVELIDGEAVWIGAGVDKLLPIAALKNLVVTERLEEVLYPQPMYYWPHSTGYMRTVTSYKLDHTEAC